MIGKRFVSLTLALGFVTLGVFFGYAALRRARWNGPLLAAVQRADLPRVQRALENGADPNAASAGDGLTALMWAVRMGNSQVAEVLLAAGAEVDHRNDRGRSALMEAAMSRRPSMARWLAARGADLNSRDDDGKSAVALARERGYRGTAQFLQMFGAPD